MPGTQRTGFGQRAPEGFFTLHAFAQADLLLHLEHTRSSQPLQLVVGHSILTVDVDVVGTSHIFLIYF